MDPIWITGELGLCCGIQRGQRAYLTWHALRVGVSAMAKWIGFWRQRSNRNPHLGGAFKHFLFSSLFGEMIQFDDHIFQMGWFNHQLVMLSNWKSHFRRFGRHFFGVSPWFNRPLLIWFLSKSRLLKTWKHTFSRWWFSAKLKSPILNSYFNIFLRKMWITKIAYIPEI